MSKASRRAARERLRQERLKEQQRAKRTRVLVAVGAAVSVVLLVVGAGYLFYTAGGSGAERSELYAELPSQSLQQDGSVVVAEEGASAPVVEVYADYQCPACKKFEEESGATLLEMAADGEAVVHYRPVSIFAQQGEPVSSNSLRAAAAARAAADHGKFVEYNDVLFEHQPPEREVGYEPGDLKDWGDEVGIDGPGFAERVDRESGIAEQFGEYHQRLMAAGQQGIGEDRLRTMTLPELMEWGNEQGIDDSFLEDSYVEETLYATGAAYARYDGENTFEGTPSIHVNGEKLGNEAFSARGLRGAVEEAGSGEVTTEPLASGDHAGSGETPDTGEPTENED